MDVISLILYSISQFLSIHEKSEHFKLRTKITLNLGAGLSQAIRKSAVF